MRTKLFCLILLTMLILSSCQNDAVQTVGPVGPAAPKNAGEGENQSIVLNYAASDSMNPYKTKSEANLLLMPLLYEPLISVNENFEAVLKAAQAVDNQGSTCVVTLKEGLVFSDGKALTADDVVYSLTTAKSSGTVFAPRLSNISTVKNDGGTIKITLKTADPFFHLCLDIPLIPKNSQSQNNPAGSGPYAFKSENGAVSLVYNEKHTGPVPRIKEIKLTEMPDYETTVRSLDIGSISLFYTDFSEGDISLSNSTFSPVPLNHLVYLGVNSKNEKLDATVRKAVNLALDRAAVTEKAFLGRALPSTGPFHPSFVSAKAVQKGSAVKNTEAAVALLEEAGYTQKDDKGIRRTKGGKRLTFQLLVNKDNAAKQRAAVQIAEALKLAGIQATVVSESMDKYKKRLEDGEYDLYLSEIKLSNHMNLAPLLTPGAPTGYGVHEEDTTLQNYKSFLKGDKNMEAFITDFEAALPFIPLCYRQGLLAHVQGLSGLRPSVSSLFENITQWTTQS